MVMQESLLILGVTCHVFRMKYHNICNLFSNGSPEKRGFPRAQAYMGKGEQLGRNVDNCRI